MLYLQNRILKIHSVNRRRKNENDVTQYFPKNEFYSDSPVKKKKS